ncbi:putative tRNA N6-adenosine threonylcarbamoyltransferase, mitochondrial [Holothuria leucospilota]|uniref:N(6)-L-threonylcarbamoyladenine synthase n=1 Tax=Holothuria leucospilota TaxID=206669 RepID=A0A9Q0YNE2_HOLLE|nr:putative tRNA N6-adenosine threonylcarbamoyltransferase, mitochondrial [Holothuria leucospilota]
MKVWQYSSKLKHYWQCIRCLSETSHGRLVLGIETSCDETGAAVVDEDGLILGEGLHSQKGVHVKNGGVIPPLAQNLHQQFIDEVVQSALRGSGVALKDLSAVATTTRPGLALCLRVGLEYSKELVKTTGLPFIPVHHMEAHALTVRMIDKSISFPYLVLLVSGGHCILAVAKGVGDFIILGETRDSAPGEAFDKIARRLKLQHHPKCKNMGGGQAMETLAKEGDIHILDGKHMFRMKSKDCDFSFISLKQAVTHFIHESEELQGIFAGNPDFLNNASDICASVQHHITRHLITRILRGMDYCKMTGLIPGEKQTLVVSGGVASNNYIRGALKKLCDYKDYKLVCPPPHLCTDNGIMIAWAGMEHLKQGTGIAEDPSSVRFEPREPLGPSISASVREARLRVQRFKFWTDG